MQMQGFLWCDKGKRIDSDIEGLKEMSLSGALPETPIGQAVDIAASGSIIVFSCLLLLLLSFLFWPN